MPVNPGRRGGGTTTTSGGGGGTTTTTTAEPIRREVTEWHADTHVQTISVPASLFDVSTTHITWQYAAASRAQLDNDFRRGTNPRYLAFIRFVRANGNMQIQIEPDRAGALTTGTRLTDAFEADGQVRITAGGHTVTGMLAGQDTSEPYTISSPPGASAAITTWAALADGSTAATVTITDGGGDGESLSDVWDDWEHQTVILASDTPGTERDFALSLDAPTGIEHGDFFDLQLIDVDVDWSSSSPTTYTVHAPDDSSGATLRLLYDEDEDNWDIYQIANPNPITEINDLYDLDTGPEASRANKGLRFNSTGDTLVSADWPSGGSSTTTTAAEPVRREVDAGVADPAIEWSINAPASVHYGGASSSSVTWDWAPAARPEITTAGLKVNASDTRYLDNVRLQRSNGEVEIRIETNRSSAARADLHADFESDGELEIVAGSNSITVSLGGADADEPYEWVPSNAAAVQTFINAVDTGDGTQAATITLRIPGDGTTPDSETLSDVWDDWEYADVILSSDDDTLERNFTLTLDEPTGIEDGDFFDVQLDHVDLTVTAASGVTYEDNGVDTDPGNVLRFVFTDRVATGSLSAAPAWTAYQLARSDALELNDLSDVATGAASARGNMAVRFNADGTSLTATAWPGTGGAEGGAALEYERIGDADRVENITLSGTSTILHEDSTDQHGIYFNNDATHLDFEIEFNASTGPATGDMGIEYSLDRGTTWYAFLDEDGDDEVQAVRTAATFEKRITREFCSERDSSWSVTATHVLWVRLTAPSGSNLAGTVNLEWTAEDDSATARLRYDEVYSTDTTLTGHSYVSNSQGYAITQIGITPVAWEKVIEVQMLFSRGTNAERFGMSFHRQYIDAGAAYFTTVPANWNGVINKSLIQGRNIEGGSSEPITVNPTGGWVYRTRTDGSETKARVMFGTQKEGAYLKKILLTALQSTITLRNIYILREA